MLQELAMATSERFLRIVPEEMFIHWSILTAEMAEFKIILLIYLKGMTYKAITERVWRSFNKGEQISRLSFNLQTPQISVFHYFKKKLAWDRNRSDFSSSAWWLYISHRLCITIPVLLCFFILPWTISRPKWITICTVFSLICELGCSSY